MSYLIQPIFYSFFPKYGLLFWPTSFIVHFLFSKNIAFSFLSKCFDVFRSLLVCFTLLIIQFLLYLYPILATADREQLTFFATPSRGLTSCRSFTILSIVLIDISCVGGHFFNEVYPTACWGKNCLLTVHWFAYLLQCKLHDHSIVFSSAWLRESFTINLDNFLSFV